MLPRKFRSLVFLLVISKAALAGLWDGSPNYDGWLGVDWFGYLYPVGDYTLHAEHGWQYPYGSSPDSVYLYDYATQSWVWTSNLVYPWIYWYGQEEDWVFYYRGASPGNRWFYVTERRGFLIENQLAPAVFESGSFSTHQVSNPGSAPTTVTDASSGLTFSVPGGQSGQLRVAGLSSAPPAPYPGQGYTIEANDLNSLELVVGPDQLDAGEVPMVYLYGEMQGAFDDETGYAERWTAIAYEEDEDGTFRFLLPEYEAPTTQIRAFGTSPTTKAAPSYKPPLRYWISKVKGSSDEVEQRVYLGLQVAAFASNLSQALDLGTRSTFESRRDRARAVLSYGENAYSGFNKLRSGSWGREFLPHIRIKSPSENSLLAHETAHYLSHLLIGDDAYDAVEGAGGYIYKTGHWIGKHIGRENLLEDYAYLIEDFLNRTGEELTWESNVHLRKLHSPLTTDIPGVEGFAATMLSVLHKKSTSIWDSRGNYAEVPPVNKEFSTVFKVLSRGALSVDTLRQYCEDALTGTEKTAFQVILGRIGWSYYIRGRLVDDKDQPISGATVRNILKIDEKIYVGGWSNVASKADGSFFLAGDVFGGESLLEVTLDSGSVIEVPIQLDWSKPTPNPIQLGKIVVGDSSDHNVSFSFDYGNDQAFPEGFTLRFMANIGINVLSGDASLVRTERTEILDYNTPIVTVTVYVPSGSELTLSGPVSVVPNSDTGSNWTLANRSVTAYPGEAFSSQTTSSAQLDSTVVVRNSGLAAQILFVSSAEFRKTDANNTYLGRFGGSIRINVIGE